METIEVSAVLIGLLLLILGAGLWIALAVLTVAYLGVVLFTSVPAGAAIATTIWGQSSSWTLTALPMFVWMGEILYRTRLSEDMFKGLAPWVSAVPGRLMHVNVIACGIFAAISGSSTATAATIGRITLPELKRRGYDELMALGSLAGSGTLGILIPPSIVMIVYGFVTGVSIGQLFIAGVLPGLLLMALFSGYIAAWALLHPARTPRSDISLSLGAKLANSRRLIPVVLLIVAVLGSIYGGIATPTESAVLGVVGALAIGAATRTLGWANFRDSLFGAMQTSCMIAFILAGTSVLQSTMGYTGIPRALAEWVGAMQLSQAALIAALAVLFIVLGCFIDGISIVVLTTAVLMPVVKQAGIDLLWFGIYLVIMVEIGLVTPPVGFNLFVIQGLTGRDIGTISRGALPFFLLLVLSVAILLAFPGIVGYLPAQMGYR